MNRSQVYHRKNGKMRPRPTPCRLITQSSAYHLIVNRRSEGFDSRNAYMAVYMRADDSGQAAALNPPPAIQRIIQDLNAAQLAQITEFEDRLANSRLCPSRIR